MSGGETLLETGVNCFYRWIIKNIGGEEAVADAKYFVGCSGGGLSGLGRLCFVGVGGCFAHS